MLYLLVTVVGLYPFRGIPVLNVALGFPIGAIVAHRCITRPRPTPDGDGLAPLRTIIVWALGSAGITMLVCWAELICTLLVVKIIGPAGHWATWLPLLPTTDSPSLFRAQLFATIVSPGLQILTTVFGGVLTLLFGSRRFTGAL